MALTKDERRKAGLFPSADLDVATALELLDWNWYRFARSTAAAPPSLIRGVLDALGEQRGKSDGPPRPRAERSRSIARVFLPVAVDQRSDEALSGTWRQAVDALKAFESQYAWGSKKKRDQLAAIATTPRLLRASQAATVACADVPDELLAVLVLDASEESLDALVPFIERSQLRPDGPERVLRLRAFCGSQTLRETLFEPARDRLDSRRAASPVLALARSLGIAKAERFRVRVDVPSSDRKTLADPGFNVWLDSAQPWAFRVTVATNTKATTFDALALQADPNHLGRCDVDELPGYLARAANRLSVRWRWARAEATYLRGARLETFIAWLRSS